MSEQQIKITKNLPLFTLGFRPFFLVAGISAVLLQGLWLLAYSGTITLPEYYGAVNWHAHEMLFGYTSAVIAGFLLTAARNWTGKQMPVGKTLAALTLLWLAGRITPFITVLPVWMIAATDFLFLPLLVMTVLIPIVMVRQWRNAIFPVLLLLLATANGMVHLVLLDITAMTPRMGLELGLFVVLTMVVIMAGRVIPFFIERGAPGAQLRRWRIIEWLSIIGIVLLTATKMFAIDTTIISWLAGITGGIHALRFTGWISRPALRVPLLWILLSGYLWIVIGLILMCLSNLGWPAGSISLHAFTAGAIAVLTVGMMSRVALGHTGRPLQPHRVIVYAFVLINMAAVVRVLVTLLLPAYYGKLIILAGLLWLIAFCLFLFIYLPMLIQPRVDEVPG